MEASAREEYLVTEVMTATPQKLQLMLIEGAMRFTEKGRMHWRAGERDSASEALIRAQEIVSQILANLNREAAPEMVAKVASIYVCVFRNLVEAALVQDEKKLDDALAVLAVERDTWRELCGKLGKRAGQGFVAGIPARSAAAGQPRDRRTFALGPHRWAVDRRLRAASAVFRPLRRHGGHSSCSVCPVPSVRFVVLGAQAAGALDAHGAGSNRVASARAIAGCPTYW